MYVYMFLNYSDSAVTTVVSTPKPCENTVKFNPMLYKNFNAKHIQINI